MAENRSGGKPGYKNRAVDLAMPGARGRGGGRANSRFAPHEKAKDAKGTLIKLLKFFSKEGKMLFLVTGLLLIHTVLTILGPFIIGKCVDAIVAGNGADFSVVDQYGAYLLTIYITLWIFNVSQGLLMNATSQKMIRALRESLFGKMQTLPLMYHDVHSHGELMSRLTNDIDNISTTIAQLMTEVITASITIIGSLAMMMVLSPVLTLILMMTIPLLYLATWLVAKKARPLFVGQQHELGRLNGMIEENITGQKMILAYHMQDRVAGSFQRHNLQMKKYSVGAHIWSGFLMPVTHILTNLGYVSVMFAGGMLAVKQPGMIGTVASFGTYSRQFAMPLNNIAGLFNNIQSALAGAERVFEIMEEEDEPADIEGAVDIGIPQGEVEFRDVSFSYIPGVNVLNHVSFKVRPGQKVALVGETGAGKTTIVNLLARFYDATEGEVRIDGLDIKRYKRESLRNAFSVVLQDTCLFTGSIADNIRYAAPEATREEIENAAAAANADAFIKRLKNGYDTQVSGGTDALSQGQRQLLAISRAVLCQSPILILDEATSSVDTRTELRIQEAFARLAQGRTTFVIAHRLSTIRDADRIMVVKDGVIAETGNHAELAALGGIYASMFEKQTKGGAGSVA